MVSGISGHDLRCPLSAVTMGADLLLRSQRLRAQETLAVGMAA